MIPTQLTDGINDSVYLLQGHTVHLPVQLVKVFFDLFVVVRVVLVVALVEQGQNRLAIAEVGGCCSMCTFRVSINCFITSPSY